MRLLTTPACLHILVWPKQWRGEEQVITLVALSPRQEVPLCPRTSTHALTGQHPSKLKAIQLSKAQIAQFLKDQIGPSQEMATAQSEAFTTQNSRKATAKIQAPFSTKILIRCHQI